MSGERTKYRNPDGTEIDVVIVEINQARECFNEYELSDGTTLRAKNVAVDVFRIIGQVNEQDDPVYILRTRNLVTGRFSEAVKAEVKTEMALATNEADEE